MRRTPLDFGEVSSSGEPLGPNLGGSLPSVKLQASTILGAFKKHLTRRTNPDLVRLVLNKEEQRVPPHIRIFAYLLHPTDSTCIRQSGLIGIRCTVQQHGRSSRYRESYSMVQLHTEFGEERFGSLEAVDNDENVVHP